MITEATVLAQILARTGDTPNADLAGGQLQLFWDGNAAYGGIWPRLQEWYTQRDAVDFLLEQDTVRNAVSFGMSGDLSMKLGERRDHLAKRRQEAEDQICKLECRAIANAKPVIEDIKRKEPELPPFFEPPQTVPFDANSPIWRGDPYRRVRRTVPW